MVHLVVDSDDEDLELPSGEEDACILVDDPDECMLGESSDEDLELPPDGEHVDMMMAALGVPAWLDGTLRDDFAEIFCPGRICPWIRAFGLRASMAIDILVDPQNHDLRSPLNRTNILLELERRRPRVVLSCAPCTWYSELNRLWNQKRMSSDKAKDKEKEATVLFDFGMLVGRRQHLRKDMYVHEHPWRASSWKLESTKELASEQGFKTVDFDQCRVGLSSPFSRIPIKKRTRLLTNLNTIQMTFGCMKCACTNLHPLNGDMVKHFHIQGSEGGVRISTHCASYPPMFCRIVAECVAAHCLKT